MLFSPFELKSVVFPNRIVMPAMCQYSAGEDGVANEWHFVHYGSRAVGGVGCLILEATAVEPRGRISRQDLGLWDEAQVEPLRQLVDFCHRHGAVMGIQIAHGGRKACGPDLVAPSPLAAGPDYGVPQELSPAEIGDIVRRWGRAAKRAAAAGFDLLQVHGAHGYLIHEFLSPLSNHRTDEYGGGLEGRMRFLLEVVEEVKANWPQDRVLSVRLSAVDYFAGGLTIGDTVQIAAALKDAGVDLVDVSSGGLLPAPIDARPGYQVPFAEAVRKEVGIPTIAVGLISTAELAEEILANGRADFVALGRELLRNPYWPLQAMSNQREKWPFQYRRAAKD